MKKEKIEMKRATTNSVFIAEQHAKTLEHSRRRMREYKKTMADRKRDPHDPIGNPVFILRTDRQLLRIGLEKARAKQKQRTEVEEKDDDPERDRLRKWVDEPLPCDEDEKKKKEKEAKTCAKLRRELVGRIVNEKLTRMADVSSAFEELAKKYEGNIERKSMVIVFQTLCKEIGLVVDEDVVEKVAEFPHVDSPVTFVEPELELDFGIELDDDEEEEKKTTTTTADEWMKDMDEVNEDVVIGVASRKDEKPTVEDESSLFPVHSAKSENPSK